MPVRGIFALSTLLIAMTFACEKDDVSAEPYLDAGLSDYFERFAQEAEQRGLDVRPDLAGVEGYLLVLEEDVAGECRQQTEAGVRKVTINRLYWNQADEYGREFIVFHELGHCVLQRSHLNTRLSDGRCASLMHGGDAACRNAYGSATRTDYLDELFQE